MVDKVIVELLKDNRRLIVPEFGAFIRKDDTGEVVFVEFLKKDDHQLTAYLSEAYSISQPQAVAAIENFVAEVKKQIMYTGGYAIQGLGVLKTGPNNMYRLEYGEIAVQPAKQPDVVNAETEAPASHITKEDLWKVDEPEVQATTPSADDKKSAADDSVKGLRYGKPNKAQHKPGKKRTDGVMIIAIIVAILAMASLVYGVVTDGAHARNLFEDEQDNIEFVETMPADSLEQ